MRQHRIFVTVGLAAITTSLFFATPSQAKLAKDIKARAMKVLEDGARSGDFTARSLAVEGMGNGAKKAVAEMVKEAVGDPQWQVQRAAITALVKMKHSFWKQALIDAMKNERLKPVDEVFPLLEPVGTKASVALMKKALTDKKFPRPERYADALLEVGGKMMIDGYNMGLALRANKDAQAAFMANIARLPLPEGLAIYKKWLPKLTEGQQTAVLQHILASNPSEDISFISKLLKSKSPDVQFNVATALGHRGNAAGKALLIEALNDADEAKRLTALRALKTIGGKSEFPLLKAIVNNENSPASLVEAAYAVYAHNKYSKLSRHLRNRIAKSNQLSHRAAAVRVLGMVEGRSSLTILHGRLGDGAPIVRRYAAMAIGDVAQPMSLKPLGDALNRETNPEAQRALIQAIGNIRDPKGAQYLTRFIYDNDAETRRSVVEALVGMRHAKTVPLLKQFLINERNAEIRRRALLGMLMLGPKKHVKTFSNAVGWIGAAELEPLVSTHKAEMLPHLKVAFNASRDELRNAALDAVAHLTKAQQAELYGLASLQSPHNKFKVRALDKLVRLQGKKSRDVLIALVKEKSARVKVAAIKHFGALRDKSAATMLIGLLDARKEVVRVAAAGALLGL